jgi:hypothetical protein
MSTFTLAALGGAPVTAAIRERLESLVALPDLVRDELWPVVERNFATSVSPGVEGFVKAFCASNGARIDDLVPIVRGLRVFFREAALRDIAPAQVTQDLNLLCGTRPDVVKLATGWYEWALPLIRTMHIVDGLEDFGAVLSEVRVRTAFMPTSQHHPGVAVPVATLALSYFEEGQRRRVCLQLPPQMVAQLKSACAQLP